MSVEEGQGRASAVTDPEARLHVVADAVAAIAGSLDLDETLRAIVEAGRDVTGAAYGALGVLGADRRIARFIVSGVTDAQIEAIGPYPTGRGILGVLIDEARPVRLSNLRDDPRSSGFPAHHPPMTSFLGVPVRARGKVFGNLYLTEAPNGAFSEDDEQLLVLLASHAGIAIDHAQTFAESRQQAADARRAARARASLTDIAGSILRERDVLKVMARPRERGPRAGHGAAGRHRRGRGADPDDPLPGGRRRRGRGAARPPGAARRRDLGRGARWPAR